MKTSVELFIESKVLLEYQPIVEMFRELIKKEYPDIKEEMRGGTEKYYGVPVYRFKRIIITLSPTQKGITFSFTDGKKFEDKYSLLEGEGNKTLNLRISKAEEYKNEILKYYISQAIEFDGLKKEDVNIIDLTPENIAQFGVCGYKDINKHLELQRKVDWVKKYYSKGLRIKALISESGGYQGMLEYIPGEYAHRPVEAKEYMFIHCIFVGFKKEFKGKGYASALIDECIKESKEADMKGVAVITRKGSFMATKDIFIKKGFSLIETAKPDFELLVLKFDEKANNPKFIINTTEDYSKGLVIMRSPQCPYSVKNVDAIMQTADKLNLESTLVELEDAESVQKVPCAFGTFCIINNGDIISHHPISNTRFENIMSVKKK